MNNILEKARALWTKEQIRVLVMLSLAMQIVLIIFAPLRKRSGKKLLLFLLWSVYLAADYVATLALGSILARTMDNTFGGHSGVDLIALWTPFLLLHLGGPDNITSYSIEDNKLWLRHLLGFAMQVSVALIVLVLLNLQSTTLLVPSILTFFVGIVKFGERTLALRAATMEQIRRWILKKECYHRTTRALKLMDGEQSISDGHFVLRSFVSFFSLTTHMVSTVDIHHTVMPRDKRVFEEIGAELSFFYDILHTKSTLVHCFRGRVVRLVSFLSISIALIFFHNSEKRGQDNLDVIITYILLLMALFLDLYSILLLVVSTWTTISLLLQDKDRYRNLADIISRAKNYVLCRHRGNKRWWSCHMGQYCLTQSCLRDIKRKRKILVSFEKKRRSLFPTTLNLVRNAMGFLFHSIENAWGFLFGDEQSIVVSDILEEMMINHVRKSLETVSTIGYRQIASKLRSSWLAKTLDRPDLGASKNLMRRKSFDECVIAWHIATEVCYFASNHSDDRDAEQRDMSKAIYTLSNYMMYLLTRESSMMPPGVPEVRIKATTKSISYKLVHYCCESLPTDVGQASECLLRVPSERWTSGMYDKSVGPLFWELWKDLRKIGESSVWRQWEVIRDAWMEMLTFAALRSSPTEHARGLSRGGELLTHYWLLLAHNEIFEEFNYDEVSRNVDV